MVGIKDVALRADVSIATVSRVMNRKGPLIQEGRRNLIHIAGNRHHETDSRAVAFEDLCSWAGAVHATYTTEETAICTMAYTDIMEQVLNETRKQTESSPAPTESARKCFGAARIGDHSSAADKGSQLR